MTEVIITPVVSVLDPGETQVFTAVTLDVLGVRIVDATVTWSARGNGTIDADGVFRASDDPAGGTATVTATSGGVVDVALVSVVPRIPTRVEVTPQAVTIAPGEVVAFNVKVFDQNGLQLSTAAVRWSVTGPGSIDAAGRYQASTDPAGGVAVVTATSGLALGTATVTVEPDPPFDPEALPGL